ncbi:type I-E CRISPR-associated protein Cse1/CasA [Streptomyces pacificus]|uniref:Type I-E CRISPR-associated protein Cse1/CasA n=1 Tax=Streptomyces pacificus TaxID=2705029 RepID=A0A6A0ATA1_9ACTN|nr:type I-E CRISPR-associated protein Cse1/CasA [Streptomyces pacificus]
MPETRPPVPAGQRASWDPRLQPCIPAVGLDGATAHHSLSAVFNRADELTALDCASPGETVAVIEYLLAICFASGTCPSSDEDWNAWILGERPVAPAAEWLLKQPADSWDLFHPTHPLVQNSDLSKDLRKSGTGTAQLIIEHSGDYNQHFDHHHLERDNPLPAADAFRATLTQHVYGPYGRARMSGGELGARVTNLAAGRLTGRIRVVALGKTLGETLRLNLYPPDGPGQPLNTSWTTSVLEQRRFEEKRKPRAPRSSADLHSALGRSVLLRPARGPHGQITVDRVLIGAGEVLDLDPARHLQDAVYSTTTNGVSKPLWPSPSRALWQQAHALYGAVNDGRGGMYARLRSLLPYRRPVPEGPAAETQQGAPYHLWAVGLLANKTLPVIWTHGAYPYAPGMAAHLYRASRCGSDIAEYLAQTLKNAAIVAAETAFPAMRAADEVGQVTRLDARYGFWPAAEDPFLELLDEVVDQGFEDDDPVSAPLVAYALQLIITARTRLLQLLDTLPPGDRYNRARARAVRLFEEAVSGDRAPAELRGETALD